MQKLMLGLIASVYVMTGCGGTNEGTETSEVSAIINEHLGISPYIPETDFDIASVILEYFPGFEDQDPYSATVNYYESLDNMEPIDKELIESWEESNPERKLIYGEVYGPATAISIIIMPDGTGELMDAEIIDMAGHDIQYQFLEKGKDGRETDTVIMFIDFDDVGYQIYYHFQSDDIEKAAKELAEDIIKNNS